MPKLSPHINLGCRSCNKSMNLEISSGFKFSKPQVKQQTLTTPKIYTKPSKKVTTLF